MKKGRFGKKLELRKLTIVNLSRHELGILKGGMSNGMDCHPTSKYNTWDTHEENCSGTAASCYRWTHADCLP